MPSWLREKSKTEYKSQSPNAVNTQTTAVFVRQFLKEAPLWDKEVFMEISISRLSGLTSFLNPPSGKQ